MISRYLKPASRRPIAAGWLSSANGLGVTIRMVKKHDVERAVAKHDTTTADCPTWRASS